MDSFDRLVEVLKIRFKDHPDPDRSAYYYIAHYLKYCVPEKELLNSIKFNEEQIIMDTLKA